MNIIREVLYSYIRYRNTYDSIFCRNVKNEPLSEIGYIKYFAHKIMSNLCVSCWCIILFVTQQSNADYGHLNTDVSRSHTITRHSQYDSSGRGIGPSQRPPPDALKRKVFEWSSVESLLSECLYSICVRASIQESLQFLDLLSLKDAYIVSSSFVFISLM